MIQMHLLNIQILWMVFTIILMIATQKEKVLIALDDMIADIMTRKRFHSVIKELFIRCRKLNI